MSKESDKIAGALENMAITFDELGFSPTIPILKGDKAHFIDWFKFEIDEIKEAVEVLRGNGADNLKEVCLTLAENIIALSLGSDKATARLKAETALSSGAAYEKFKEFVSAQGGNITQIENTDLLPKAKIVYEVLSPESGYIEKMQAETIGSVSVILGAGRLTKEDNIDYSAGIILHKKTGDRVEKGQVIAELHTNNEGKLKDAENLFLSALSFSGSKPSEAPLIYRVIR